jgi:hypothetical protein
MSPADIASSTLVEQPHSGWMRNSAQALHVRAEEHVGAEQDLGVGRDRVHDLDGVARGAAVVALGLHVGGGVHVRHDDGAGMLGLPRAELLRVDRRGERAPGREVGEKNRLVRREHGGGLRHEVHAAEDDDVRVGLGGLAREPEGVADVVGHVLHLGPLVVVGEDDRVLLACELLDLALQLGDELFP